MRSKRLVNRAMIIQRHAQGVMGLRQLRVMFNGGAVVGDGGGDFAALMAARPVFISEMAIWILAGSLDCRARFVQSATRAIFRFIVMC